jgi:branched-chain amino acid transport system permease protein
VKFLIRLIQQLINGFSIGFIYALIAIGYSLIYSILSFSNFAHSVFLIAGAYAGFFLLVYASIPVPFALIGAVIGAACVAVFTEKAAYKPIREKGNPSLYFIIASMGMAIFGENLVIATIGARFRSYPQLLPVSAVRFAGLSISVLDILAAVTGTKLLLILVYIVNKTKEGIAIRAASFDLETVGLMGVNTTRLIMFVFIAAGALAGLAGFFLGAKYTVYPQLGMLTIKAYIAAVFGGLGSLSGAVLGSVLLGVMETLVAGYLSSAIRDILVFALLIVTLLFRPSGLMGVRREDKV